MEQADMEQAEIEMLREEYYEQYHILPNQPDVEDDEDIELYNKYMDAIAKGECPDCATDERGYCDDCTNGGKATKSAK